MSIRVVCITTKAVPPEALSTLHPRKAWCAPACCLMSWSNTRSCAKYRYSYSNDKTQDIKGASCRMYSALATTVACCEENASLSYPNPHYGAASSAYCCRLSPVPCFFFFLWFMISRTIRLSRNTAPTTTLDSSKGPPSCIR